MTWITRWSESSFVPPVTAERSPPASRITGRRLAGDRRLVDRADALDDLAVGRDDLAGRRRRRCRRAAGPAPGTSSSVPSSSRRCAVVVVRVARSAFACALPRPSATASAKFANSTVSQSQNAITPTNQSEPVCPRTRSSTKIPVVITLPSSTMNITGFLSWSRGSSFGNESATAPRTISGEKMLLDLRAI